MDPLRSEHLARRRAPRRLLARQIHGRSLRPNCKCKQIGGARVGEDSSGANRRAAPRRAASAPEDRRELSLRWRVARKVIHVKASLLALRRSYRRRDRNCGARCRRCRLEFEFEFERVAFPLACARVCARLSHFDRIRCNRIECAAITSHKVSLSLFGLIKLDLIRRSRSSCRRRPRVEGREPRVAPAPLSSSAAAPLTMHRETKITTALPLLFSYSSALARTALEPNDSAILLLRSCCRSVAVGITLAVC